MDTYKIRLIGKDHREFSSFEMKAQNIHNVRKRLVRMNLNAKLVVDIRTNPGAKTAKPKYRNLGDMIRKKDGWVWEPKDHKNYLLTHYIKADGHLKRVEDVF